MIQVQLEQVLAWAAPATTPPPDDIVRAKQEYFDHTGGEVHEDDRCYEQRMQAFVNWYLFDRKEAGGETPVERFLREKGASQGAAEKSVLLGFTQTRLSLYEYRGNGGLFRKPAKGHVAVRDVFSGEDYQVTERRTMHGMDSGDLFEARLVPVDGAFHFSTSFCYHPRTVRAVILKEVRRRKKSGQPIDPRAFCWELEKMELQSERFRNVPIDAIYNFEAPFLARGKRAGEAAHG